MSLHNCAVDNGDDSHRLISVDRTRGLASAEEPCSALTQPAVQAVIATIGGSRAASTTGRRHQRNQREIRGGGELQCCLPAGRGKTVPGSRCLAGLQRPLHTIREQCVSGIPDSRTVREVSNLLHYARHWASISTAYHVSSSARSSITLTGEALTLMDPLGASAVECYVGFYGLP